MSVLSGRSKWRGDGRVISLRRGVRGAGPPRHKNPRPFVWTASVEHILQKVARAEETLAALH